MPHLTEEARRATKEKFASRIAFLGRSLEGKIYLMGDDFTVADGYAFYAMRLWQNHAKGDLPDTLTAYYARISERPSVKAAIEAEGQ